MESVIRTEHLTKKFGNFVAVNDVTLTVGKGEIYGFLGLNGAGKTTTIRMLLGMIRPSQGSVTILGMKADAGNFPLWKNVGYLVETPYAYPELSVRENLEIYRKLRRIPDCTCVDRTMSLLKISQYESRKAKHLSLGNAQRLGLAKALMHNPAVLLLDEPTNGLDPAGIVEVREMLKDLAESGITVFISSHILGEISKIAHRIGIIHNGMLLEESTAAELEKHRLKRLFIDAPDRNNLEKKLADAGIAFEKTDDNRLFVGDATYVDHPENLNEKLSRAGVFTNLLSVDEEDLETYFLRIIGENDRSAQ
jgi:ABC-2 type transport system ATP-binding protein